MLCLPPERDAGVRIDSVGERSTFHCKLFDILNLFTTCYLFLRIISVSCSVVSDSATSWTVAHQAPLSMGFPRQEYWIGLPFLSPENLPNPGIKPMSPALVGEFLIWKD